MRNSLLVLTLALGLSIACDSSTDCSSMDAGDAQDHCYKEEILAMEASQIEEVQAQSALISDDMIRQYAVSTWVEEHANEISLDQGRVLCDILEGRDASYCLRRLSSPHLQR